MTNDLTALAERVEALAGPHFQTECDIHNALGLTGTPKPYTASLDAAMTLVPEGWHVYSGYQERERGNWHWVLHSFAHPDDVYIAPQSGCAATPALALTAAALRASSEQPR